MSDPRPGQRFTLDEGPVSSDQRHSKRDALFTPADPAPGERYSLEAAHHPLEEPTETPVESALDRALAHPRKRYRGLLAILLGTLVLGGLQAFDALSSAWLGGNLLSGAWSVLGLGVVTLAASALGRELLKLRRLRRHARLRERVEARLDDDTLDGANMFELCDQLRRRMGLSDRDPHWQDFRRAHQQHHDAAETRALFAHYALAPRDARARALITRMSGETAMLVAISPLTITDMGLMAWRNLRMIDRLAELYGLELGYASRLRLFRAVLANMAFAGASEIATEASMDLLSMNLAGKLSSRAGQGLASGLLTARLGIRTLKMLRPLPYEDERVPKIGDLRRQLWQQMKRVDDSKAKEP